MLRVTDTGIGIPAEQQDVIFEAFHQVYCGTTRQFSGTGLGLAICRNLVEVLGGNITVESVESVGSTFTVSLPLREVEAATYVAPERLGDARVLVIDCNAMKAAVLAGLVEPQVGETVVVTTLSAACEALKSASTDHLIIDVRSTAVDRTEWLSAVVDRPGQQRLKSRCFYRRQRSSLLSALPLSGRISSSLSPWPEQL